VAKDLVPKQKALVSGLRVRIVDGNHLPASEKRLGVLRGFRGAALPGHSLVVYDPELDLVSDLVACEDAHAQERTIMQELIERIQPGERWIADRQFNTSAILWDIASRNARFLIREHGANPNPTELGPLKKVVSVRSAPLQTRSGVARKSVTWRAKGSGQGVTSGESALSVGAIVG